MHEVSAVVAVDVVTVVDFAVVVVEGAWRVAAVVVDVEKVMVVRMPRRSVGEQGMIVLLPRHYVGLRCVR